MLKTEPTTSDRQIAKVKADNKMLSRRRLRRREEIPHVATAQPRAAQNFCCLVSFVIARPAFARPPVRAAAREAAILKRRPTRQVRYSPNSGGKTDLDSCRRCGDFVL